MLISLCIKIDCKETNSNCFWGSDCNVFFMCVVSGQASIENWGERELVSM